VVEKEQWLALWGDKCNGWLQCGYIIFENSKAVDGVVYEEW